MGASDDGLSWYPPRALDLTRPSPGRSTDVRLVVALAAALTFVARSARAQDADLVAISWNAPPECPSDEAVLREIARSKRVTPAAAHTLVLARARVFRDDGGRWHAELEITAGGVHGARALEAETCAAIADATALIVGLALERKTSSEPRIVASPIPPPAPGPPPPAPPRLGTRWQIVVGAATALDVGTMPAPAPGVEATAGMAMTNGRARLRLLLGGTLLPAQTYWTGAANGSAGGRFDLLGAWGRVCGALLSGRFDFGPCIGAELDRMSGVAVGAATPVTAARDWGTALASALVSWTITSSFAAYVHVDAVIPFARPTFFLQGMGVEDDVERPASIAARGALGFEVHFL
jgi:hypothetical protein